MIVRKEVTEKTAGGIYLAQTDEKKRLGVLATVIAVGEGRVTEHGARVPQNVAPGDKVLISGIAGLSLGEEVRIELGIDDEEFNQYHLVTQTDVIGRIK
jgi:chaperonin GroES